MKAALRSASKSVPSTIGCPRSTSQGNRVTTPARISNGVRVSVGRRVKVVFLRRSARQTVQREQGRRPIRDRAADGSEWPPRPAGPGRRHAFAVADLAILGDELRAEYERLANTPES